MKRHLMSREEFLLWFAGFVDGDGTIGVGGKQPHKVVRLRVSNTNLSALKYIQGRVGGSIYGEGHMPRGGKRISYELTFNPAETYDLLTQMGAYLRIKFEQAQIAIEYQETKIYACKDVPFEVSQRRKEIEDRFTELNAKGPVSSKFEHTK